MLGPADAPAAAPVDPPVSRRAWLLAAALALVPLAWLVVLAAQRVIDVPLFDAWYLVPAVGHAFEGTLSWDDLFALHNEHRPLFSRLLLVALARATHWRFGCEIAANVVVGAGIYAAFLGLALRALREATPSAPAGRTPAVPAPADWAPAVLAPALSVLFFSFVQWDNWSVGWQVQLFLEKLALVLGLGALGSARFSPARLGLALACGVVATFTLASGFLYWPLGALVLALRHGLRERRVRLALAAWGLAFVLVALAYFHGYEEPREHADRLHALAHPLDFASFLLSCLGAPVASRDRRAAAAIAALALALSVLSGWRLARRGVDLRALLGPAALALDAIGNAALVAFGRAGYGPKGAMTSRYTTLVVPFWGFVVLVLVLVLVLEPTPPPPGERRRALRSWPHAALALLVLGALASSIRESEAWRQEFEERLLPSRVGVTGPDWAVMKRTFYDGIWPKAVEEIQADLGPKIEVLRKHRLGPFREDAGEPR